MAETRPDLKAYRGKRLPIIAWIWARTVRSPNPAVRGTALLECLDYPTPPRRQALQAGSPLQPVGPEGQDVAPVHQVWQEAISNWKG